MSDDFALAQKCGTPFFLSEKFEPQLIEAREAAARLQQQYNEARRALEAQVAQALGRDQIESEEFIVMRSASLPKGVRVLRETQWFYLCEVEEDSHTSKLSARLNAATARVAELERAAREQAEQRA